ncbi:uncharacterized protein LOC111134172 [Crassostrea virginica]
MYTLWISLNSLSTSPTQQTKRTECCVLGTVTTQEPRYLILSTSPVLTTGDTSSTTTTELILRILRDTIVTPGMSSVKWKYTDVMFTHTARIVHIVVTVVVGYSVIT